MYQIIMQLPCQIAIKKISKLGIVPKYTITFGLLTFIISLIIFLTILFETRDNFELTFISRAYCFTNSLKLSLEKISKLSNKNPSKFLKEVTSFIFTAEQSGNILYKKTEIIKNSNCKNIKNPKHIISLIPGRNRYFITCFKINQFVFLNYFSPEYYQNKLTNLEKTVIIIFIIGFLIYILIVYLLFKKLLSPIVCLSNTMNEYEIGKKCDFSDMEHFINKETKDEISILMRSYCSMLNRLEKLYEEREKLTQLMHRARKFATIGELVSGLAHEINNPLGGIKNCIYNLKKRNLPDEKKEKYITLMEQGINLIDELMRKLLNFSKASVSNISEVNLKKVIYESAEFLKNKLMNNNIELEINSPDNVIIQSNKYALMQIFLNLLINSIDALKEKNVEKKLIKINVIENIDTILIEFWDNGIGIPIEIIDKIFEPFFTTKDLKRGNGLGLFIVDGIISALKYSIKVESKEGEWTKFTIIIPKN